MTRRVLTASFIGLAACAATRDIYVGSDFAADGATQDAEAVVVRDVGSGGTDGASRPPAAASGSAYDASMPTLPVVCTGSTGDCDGDLANGCEADLMRDPAHCGRCGSACQFPDCSCRDGQLVVECAPGRADCDANPRNGCEVDIRTTMQHCGACGRLCHTNGHDAIAAVCVAGQCQITCQVEAFPEGDCDGNPDNGCETQLWANDEHCGMCGRRCTCRNGACQ